MNAPEPENDPRKGLGKDVLLFLMKFLIIAGWAMMIAGLVMAPWRQVSASAAIRGYVMLGGGLGLAVVAVVRCGAAVAIGRGVLRDQHVLRDLWLLPLRDFAALAVWIASFAGNEVEWRGMKFRVKDGKLERP